MNLRKDIFSRLAKDKAALLKTDRPDYDSESSSISEDSCTSTSPIDLESPTTEDDSPPPSAAPARNTIDPPLLSTLNLKDIDSIRRYILYLQLALCIPLQYSDTRKRDYDRPTTSEKNEVARCKLLLANNIVLKAIVNRFLENWEQVDARVLAVAQWLNRTARRNTFVVGSEAWERTRKRWIEVHDLQGEGSEGVMWTYNMPELGMVESVALGKEVEAAKLEVEVPAWKEGRILTVHDLRAAIARR